jgi:outer membrane protein OmpA-like peptidoglycan-associated protein
MPVVLRNCVALTALAMLTTAAIMAASKVGAQAAPSSEQMIEQLKKPQSRSLRNLNVEAVNPKAAEANAAAPSTIAVTHDAPSSAQTTSAANAPTATPLSLAAAANPISAAEAKPSLSLLIQFDLNSARVKPESQQALANLAVALKSPELLPARFAVEGHTDATGRADHNQRLSQQRAEAVRDVLAAQGVARQRLQTSGKGSTELVNSADPASFENRACASSIWSKNMSFKPLAPKILREQLPKP